MNEAPKKIPGGLALMMKSFGLDPVEIKNSIMQFGDMIRAIDDNMREIKAANARIELMLQQWEVEGARKQ